MDAIKTFHTGVSEDFLLKEPQFKALRDRLLRSASDYYGKLAALRVAVARGYGNPVALRRDTDLDALRDRRDFRNLVMDLQFPTEVFAPGP